MDFSSFLTSLATLFMVFVVLMLLFTWLSRKSGNMVVYSTRIGSRKAWIQWRGGLGSRNLFTWIWEAMSSSEEDVIINHVWAAVSAMSGGEGAGNTEILGERWWTRAIPGWVTPWEAGRELPKTKPYKAVRVDVLGRWDRVVTNGISWGPHRVRCVDDDVDSLGGKDVTPCERGVLPCEEPHRKMGDSYK
ncbi:hypothetical protein LguiB_008548 [Lonicera macranthoides]